MSLENVLADNGVWVPVGSLAQQITRDVDDNIDYIEVTWRDITYRKTVTRDGDGAITSTGTDFEWVAQ